MDTAVAIEKKKTAVTDEPCLVYELSRQEKSSWRPKNKGKMKDIKTAKYLSIDVRSRWYGGPTMGEVEIQYVPGAPTIFVNDYDDEKGNVKKGLRSLYGERLDTETFRRAIEEDIKFVDGVLFLEHYGGAANKTLVDFISHHEFNEAAPNHRRKPKMNTIFLFKPLIKEKKAALDLDSLETEEQAIVLLGSLTKKKGDTREYDIPKINAILGILQEGNNLGDNESSQKVLLIRSFVHRNPVAFLKAYNEGMEEYSASIKVASELGVIDFNGKEATVKITGLTPEKIEMKRTKREEQVEDLAFYFLGTEKGVRLYSQTLGEVEKKKIEAFSKK